MGCVVALVDGRVVSGGGHFDRSLRAWDVATGSCTQHLTGHILAVECVVGLADILLTTILLFFFNLLLSVLCCVGA